MSVFTSLIFILSSFVLVGGAMVIYLGNRKSSKHRAVALSFVLMACWQQAALLINLLPSEQSKYVFMYGLIPLLMASFLMLLHAVYIITGVYSLKRAVLYKAVFVPPFLNIMLFPVDGWLYSGELMMYSGEQPPPGPGGFINMGIMLVLLVVMVARLFPHARRKHRPNQIWMLGMALSMLWVLAIVVLGELTGHADIFGLVPLGINFWAAAVYISIYKFDTLPSYEKRYSVLFEKAPIGILIADQQGIIREASPTIAEYLSKPLGKVIGCSLFDWLDEHEKEHQMRLYLDNFEKRKVFRQVELSIHNPNGEQRFISLSSDYIEMEGNAYKLLMINDTSESKQKERQIHDLAYFDQLTGLHNRVSFNRSFEEWRKQIKNFVLIILDLNEFKAINDRYGHLAGDRALQHFAAMLKDSLGPTDFVGRLSGDEFVIMLSSNERTDTVIQSIRGNLRKPFEPVPGELLELSAGIGVGLYPQEGTHLDELFKEVDTRMYADKKLQKMVIA